MTDPHTQNERLAAEKGRRDADHGVYDPPTRPPGSHSYALIYVSHCARRAYHEAHLERRKELAAEGHPYVGQEPAWDEF